MGKSIKQCHQKRKEEKKAFNKALLGICTWELGLDEFEQEGVLLEKVTSEGGR